MQTQFTALVDFDDAELRSVYCAGLSYTHKPVEEFDTTGWPEKRVAVLAQRCDLLAQKLPQWAAEGKIAYGGQPARITGGD